MIQYKKFENCKNAKWGLLEEALPSQQTLFGLGRPPENILGDHGDNARVRESRPRTPEQLSSRSPSQAHSRSRTPSRTLSIERRFSSPTNSGSRSHSPAHTVSTTSTSSQVQTKFDLANLPDFFQTREVSEDCRFDFDQLSCQTVPTPSKEYSRSRSGSRSRSRSLTQENLDLDPASGLWAEPGQHIEHKPGEKIWDSLPVYSPSSKYSCDPFKTRARVHPIWELGTASSELPGRPNQTCGGAVGARKSIFSTNQAEDFASDAEPNWRAVAPPKATVRSANLNFAFKDRAGIFGAESDSELEQEREEVGLHAASPICKVVGSHLKKGQQSGGRGRSIFDESVDRGGHLAKENSRLILRNQRYKERIGWGEMIRYYSLGS